MSDYQDVTVPGAPLRGVEELQGQLDRLAESTSAALRRVEHERDAALAERDNEYQHARLMLISYRKSATEAFRHVETERDLARAELASAQQELDAVRTARDNLGRELAEARKATGWIVARDGGRDCARCDQEIRRGEAYEYLPTTDLLQHIHCRLPEES